MACATTGHGRSARGELRTAIARPMPFVTRPSRALVALTTQRDIQLKRVRESLGLDHYILGDGSRLHDRRTNSPCSHENRVKPAPLLRYKTSRMQVIITAVERQQPQNHCRFETSPFAIRSNLPDFSEFLGRGKIELWRLLRVLFCPCAAPGSGDFVQSAATFSNCRNGGSKPGKSGGAVRLSSALITVPVALVDVFLEKRSSCYQTDR